MSDIDPRLKAFIARCDALGSRLALPRSTLSHRLFKDTKRIDAIAGGGSDIGIGRLAKAERELAQIEESTTKKAAA